MSAPVDGEFEPEGPRLRRAVQILTTHGAGGHRRGSGYRVASDVVLTAAHVVEGATSVRVRFLTRDSRTWEVPGESVWSDSASDIALLRIADDSGERNEAGSGELRADSVPPARFARITQQVECETLGFPWFKLRGDTTAPDPAAPTRYRDSHRAHGWADPVSNWRSGTLEVSLTGPPEADPAEPNRSPWEGMSGAAVWSGGYVIGVVSGHHRPDGLGRLAASRVDRWYDHLTPAQIDELGDLMGLPADAEGLARLPHPSRPPALREAAGKLARAVSSQWEGEERRRRVHDPFPLAVRFRPAERHLFDHWASIRRARRGVDPGPLPLTGRLDGILKAYRSIPSRRLVVLGAAGSGKTILTLRFVLDWLRHRDPGDPVPVIFGLGSWDPTALSLRDWMCGRLERDYGLAAPASAPDRGSLAGALVDADWILPVLDGFDEIASGLQDVALRQLNYTAVPLLLTSRPAEYASAVRGGKTVLKGAAAVELASLTLDDLAGYLPLTSTPGSGGNLHSTVWEPVLDELDAEPRSPGAVNVATVLTTPLMVAMARTVYSETPGHDPAELLDTERFPTPAALREHLLAAFVRAAYDQPPADQDTGRRQRAWNPDRAQHWLRQLATHLTELDTRDLEWWRLGTAMGLFPRSLIIGLLAALALGVPTAVGNIPVDVLTSHRLGFAVERGVVVGVLHGLVSGLFFGLVYRFVSRGRAEPSRVRVQIFGRSRESRTAFRPRFVLGLGLGSLAALVLVLVDRSLVAGLGLDDGLGGGNSGALIFVPGFGLGVGLVLGIMTWLEAPIDIRSAVSPADLLSTNRRNVVFHLLVWAGVFGLWGGIATGFVAVPVFGFVAGPLLALLGGLVFGLTAAFAGGLGYGLSFTAWGQWVALARIWLPLTGRVPWHLIAFLDDACRRGVLRQAGAVYQFRHAQLQNHLALPESRTATTGSAEDTTAPDPSGDQPGPNRDSSTPQPETLLMRRGPTARRKSRYDDWQADPEGTRAAHDDPCPPE